MFGTFFLLLCDENKYSQQENLTLFDFFSSSSSRIGLIDESEESLGFSSLTEGPVKKEEAYGVVYKAAISGVP